MPTNQIQQFAATASEAAGDILSLEDYAAHPQRAAGHQKGIARRALENRVLRQLAHMAAGLAQFIANRYEPGVVDDADLDKVEEGMADAILDLLGGYGKNLSLAGQVLSLLSETGATLGQVTLPGVTGYGKNLGLSGLVLSLLSESGATLGSVSLPTVPPGIILPYGAATAPTGFLECNGAAVSRATYAALYAAISTTWGVGDGSTTFNIPDLRGYFLRPWDHGRGVDPGRAFGSVQDDSFESHRHESIRYTDGQSAVLSPGDGPTQVGPTPQMGENTYPVLNTGSAGGVETRPKNVAVLYVIKY